MQQQAPSTLDVIYESWRGYHEKLRDCIAPLTNEQLLLQPRRGRIGKLNLIDHETSEVRYPQTSSRVTSTSERNEHQRRGAHRAVQVAE